MDTTEYSYTDLDSVQQLAMPRDAPPFLPTSVSGPDPARELSLHRMPPGLNEDARLLAEQAVLIEVMNAPVRP